MNNKVFGIVGWSGSGKTDLTCRIIKYLTKKKICVSSIKHSHHTFEIDKKGKDSFKHLQSGSNEVIIFNEKKWAQISALQTKKIRFDEIIKKISKKTDVILVEGLKHNKTPKLEVVRKKNSKPLICENDDYIKAIVFDEIFTKLSKIDLPKFKFNETRKIADFILDYTKNGKI